MVMVPANPSLAGISLGPAASLTPEWPGTFVGSFATFQEEPEQHTMQRCDRDEGADNEKDQYSSPYANRPDRPTI